MITIILTYSRGGWLIAVILTVIYIIFLDRNVRWGTAGYFSYLLSISMICSVLLGIVAEDEQIIVFWSIILSGAGLMFLFPELIRSFKHKKAKIIAISSFLGLIMLISVASGFFIRQKNAEPMILIHPLSEPKTEKLYEEHINVTPFSEHKLSMELFAIGNEDQPFGWRVRVLGRRDNGQEVTLTNIRGDRLDTWEKREFSFKTPEDVGRIVVQVVNAYPGIELTARNIQLIEGNRKRNLSFIGHRILPDALYSRIVSFDWNDNAVQERLRFFRDALAIISDYPLFGIGGQGWVSRYFQYQSVAYFSKKVHNHFLQVWVDAGIIGFLSFIGIILCFMLISVRIIRKTGDSNIKNIIMSSTFAFMAIVGHSVYDFNLSLGAIGIFLAALMGIIRALDTPLKKEKSMSNEVFSTASMSLSLGFLILSSILFIGHTQHTIGREKLEQNNINDAAIYLEKAARYDPYNAKIRMDLAAAYESLAREEANTNLIEKAEQELRKVIVLDRYHPRSSLIYGQFLIRRQSFEEGLDYLEKSLRLNPRFARSYVAYA